MIIWRGMDCAPHDEDILLLPAGKVARWDVEIERFVDISGYVVDAPTAWAYPPKVDWVAQAFMFLAGFALVLGAIYLAKAVLL